MVARAYEVLGDEDTRRRYDNGEDVDDPNAQKQQQYNLWWRRLLEVVSAASRAAASRAEAFRGRLPGGGEPHAPLPPSLNAEEVRRSSTMTSEREDIQQTPTHVHKGQDIRTR